MTYPQIVEYNDAIQEPSKAFADSELKSGAVELSPLGLPFARSGGFALTYSIQCRSSRYAVRCFHREVPGVEQRYAAISDHLRRLNSPYFVSFDFQRDGILVRGARHPIVKMDWVVGDTLGMFLERHYSNALKLRELKERFFQLACFLEQQGIAHGDIQNENVIVEPSGIKLIDYDGMYVPGLPLSKGTEVGHKHFQHPSRDVRHFGPKMDRFSWIVLDVSFDALVSRPSLHPRFNEGGQAIIFKANDFQSPASSSVFQELKNIAGVSSSAEKLAAICLSDFADVPDLADFRLGKNIPVPSISVSIAAASPSEASYIGAFDVLDATQYEKVRAHVGDKVELVGKVVSVKIGRTRYGKPYVFVNFGDWRGNSVKLTIWSEGLESMSNSPDDSWVGKWLSVTGLIEPPYKGRAGRQSYESIGITVSSQSQLMRISASDAKYRLGAKGSRQGRRSTQQASSNRDVLRDLPGASGSAPRSNTSGRPHLPPGSSTSTPNNQPAPKTKASAPKSNNQKLLAGIKSAPPKKATIPSPPTPPAPVSGNSGGGTVIFWFVIAVIVVIAMLNG